MLTSVCVGNCTGASVFSPEHQYTDIITNFKSRQTHTLKGIDSIHTHAVGRAGYRHTIVNVNLTGSSSVANCTLTGEVKWSHWCTATTISTGTWLTCWNDWSHHVINLIVFHDYETKPYLLYNYYWGSWNPLDNELNHHCCMCNIHLHHHFGLCRV